MYPFLYMAEATGDESWIQAAQGLFQWAEHVVSQPDGSYLNDLDSDWKGTTVFNVIQLADCLLFHGDVLPENLKSEWELRLEKAAEFLYTFHEINDNNINYPVCNALALYECGVVLGETKFQEKSGELAALAGQVLTENHLLFGEGVPRFQESARGCRPVDIGYNVEETLPSLALYGLLSGDEKAAETAEKGLLEQLVFMAEDGSWDNSFGTRNFKWTCWGSRTSDGCALGYLLLADRYPQAALAAGKNLELLRTCTCDGLLAGGPHYQAAGQPVCVHHTFTHAKVLAGILDRGLCRVVEDGAALPRQELRGIRYYPEIASWLVTQGSMTATVTAYDWEYLPGGHVSGGTLSFLYQKEAGTILCAGMGQYTLKEPANMQIPIDVRHECLALRIEAWRGNELYSSVYEDLAIVEAEENRVRVHGDLKNMQHREPPSEKIPYSFTYEWKDDGVSVRAECSEGVLICPVISRSDETVEISDDEKEITIIKEQISMKVKASQRMHLPYGKTRIFNLVPGFQALRLEMDFREALAGFSIFPVS